MSTGNTRRQLFAFGSLVAVNAAAAFLNDDWDGFQQHRIAAEREKLYPYRKTVQPHRRAAA